ncbi:hypothetical protein BDF19DRAFT_145131 [Syncephalis fuscata]|nr:hypothetical protein BDF19DRAFT_145131 [Syncephalis fuscata]
MDRSEEERNTLTIKMISWSNVFSPRLEPKHQSLLWLMQHGAVNTATQLTHFIPNTTKMCPICLTHTETLLHYFYECKRTNEFWGMIGRFLDRISSSPHQSTPLELADVLNGMRAWNRSIPGINVMHAAAVWQIYRSHTETIFDKEKVTAITMLVRWQSEVINRIRSHLKMAIRTNDYNTFEKTWATGNCQWFSYERGGGVNGCNRVIFNNTLIAPLTPSINNSN